MKSKLFGLLVGIGIYAFAAQPAAAVSISFVTPSGSTCGGEACAAEATFTTGAGSISVTLTDLLTPAQVLSAGQALSDLSFTLSNAPGTQGALTASGQLANIGAGGTVTNVSGTPVRFIGEGPPPPGGSGTFTVSGNTILMEAIGGGQPSQMILPFVPNGGTFPNANASLLNFSPSTVGPATFVLDFAGITAATTVTAATFSFGTGPDFFIPGVPVPGPIVGAGLPGLVAACVGLLALARRRRQLVV